MDGTIFSVTYAELATRLGITVPSAKNLCRRKQWPRSAGNDGLTRVTVPIDALDSAMPALSRRRDTPDAGPVSGVVDDPVRDTALAVLTAHIDRLNAGMMALQAERDVLASLPVQVAALRATLDAVTAERDRLLTREHLRESRPWWKKIAG